ncbi:MAG: HD domain-containing phosphohydrolase [Negativicutes bacterium]|nr:HD domain-containing phosphohydrolase [Negativicutes bacterium]
MLRLAIEFIRPGMELARDILGKEGQTVLTAGVKLIPRHIEILQKWDIASAYIVNPLFELPSVDEVMQEKVRNKVLQSVKSIFDKAAKVGTFNLAGEHQEQVKTIIKEVVLKRSNIIHLAQINRHRDDGLTHSINVAVLSTVIAVTMGHNRDNIYPLTLGALLHDFGKVFVPKNILAKPALTQDEFEVLNNHTVYGYEALKKIEGFPLLAAHIAFQHHERFDGSGFPRKLAGNDITTFARIVSVANEFDNLVAGTAGIPGMEMHLAYEAIVAQVNSAFDPDVAKAFLSKIALYPVGTYVHLTTGQVGVVTKVVPLAQHRPSVKIIADESGLLAQSVDIDLVSRENLTMFIKDVLNDSEKATLLEKSLIS